MIIILLISFFVILKVLEFLYPLREQNHSWIKRGVTNGAMAILVFLTAFITIKPTSQFMIQWGLINHFGLLAWIKLPPWVSFIIGFLLMDVTFYYWHRMNHSIPLLWRFHNVHHIDPDLDVTTAFRFHFIEIGYSSIFRIFQLGLIGIAPFTFFIYEFCFQLITLFHHSNIRLPEKLERLLNIFLVTPRMHGIHHSHYKSETNSNYSVIFTVWDRMHKTLNLNIPQTIISIGVPAYQDKKDNFFKNIILLPFKTQRRYWKTKSKTFYTRP